MNILVINGPNINMIGIREPKIYGSKTYQDLKMFLKQVAKDNNIKLKMIQSNSEGKIVTIIQKAYNNYDGIIINAGAFTHYSYAIFDAIKAIGIRTCEVHLSDIDNREEFRKHSVIRPVCEKYFYGKGFASYKEAIEYLKGV